MYIVIEGQDATGKDTQANLLVDHFKKKGKNVVTYSESGTGSSDPFVSEIAKLTYGSKQDIDHKTRVLLYLVNRHEQWRKLAEPALKKGDIVITARNWLSTLIYEGYAAGVSRDLIIKLHRSVMPKAYFTPDHILMLTLPDEVRAERLAEQGRLTSEFWKSKPDSFQNKINKGYLRVADEYKIPTVDTSGPIEETHKKILKMLEV